MIPKPLVVAGMAACALAAVGLVGCGGGDPSRAQLRETVHRYLDATTPAERCQLLTTVYRTQNPDVLLSGGCRQSEALSTAAEDARKKLRIAKVDVRGGQATVTLGASSSSASAARDAAGSQLTGIYLRTESGQWRIDGFSASGSGTASAG